MNTILMKCNRAVYRKNTYKISNRKICADISVDPPDLMCRKAALKYIQRIITTQKPAQIYDEIKFNNKHRICSKIGLKHKFSKEVSKRTLIHTSVSMFNNLDASLKYLQPKKFKLQLKKLKQIPDTTH